MSQSIPKRVATTGATPSWVGLPEVPLGALAVKGNPESSRRPGPMKNWLLDALLRSEAITKTLGGSQYNKARGQGCICRGSSPFGQILCLEPPTPAPLKSEKEVVGTVTGSHGSSELNRPFLTLIESSASWNDAGRNS